MLDNGYHFDDKLYFKLGRGENYEVFELMRYFEGEGESITENWVYTDSIEWNNGWFYTDSVTDLPLLERVGHPVITNPDPLLYWTARRRQWPVIFFDPPPAENS